MQNSILDLDQVSVSFDGFYALTDLDFKLYPGELRSIIGPNGAGKTTTFNMIAGAEKPSSGKIFLLDQEITGLQTEKLYYKGLMRTFQLSHEYAKMTSLENLMVAGPSQVGENMFMNWISPMKVINREKEILDRAVKTLDFLGLNHVRDELAGNLSGGQKKLLELGRTMMGDSKCVLLDEPGAGVNPTLMVKVTEMIRTLNEEQGYTFCIIEHDMDLIANLCKNVIVLNDGQILMQGTMEQVRNDERVIDAYFGGGVI